MAKNQPKSNATTKIERQIKKAGLPTEGSIPFIPKLVKNKKGQPIIKRGTVQQGPKQGQIGYVDANGRIWIRCRAHATYPDHWDVQVDGGKLYFRVDGRGNLLP